MTNAIKNIAVYVTADESSTAAIATAAKLAKAHDAKLVGVHAMSDPTAIALAPAGGGVAAGTMMQEMREEAEKNARQAERLFKEATTPAGLQAEWHSSHVSELPPREEVARAAFLADLMVMPRLDAGGSEAAIEDAVTDSGRPVIVHPEKWEGEPGQKHAVVAWKPSRQAARAVADALPFLQRAGRVTVFAATPDESGENPPAAVEAGELCLYLKNHGIDASAQVAYEVNDGDSGDALLSWAADNDADLIVAGAFSHSRLRESLFGGVSRELIEKSSVPVLLSH